MKNKYIYQMTFFGELLLLQFIASLRLANQLSPSSIFKLGSGFLTP